MAVLRVDGISKEIQGRRIFSNVCLEVHSGERVALIGRNGVGKTTLLKCLMGNLDVDKGSIHRGIGLSDYGMMEQHAEIPEYMSLFDYVFSAKHDLYEAKQSLLGLEKRVAESSTHESLFSAYAEALNHYLKLDGYGQEVDAGNVLRRMQFPESSWTQPYVTLSGGEKTRAQLARLMVLRPKFLLLDEPTNHLDAEMLDWVEAWVRQYRGTILFVSHDRHFIDAVATSTYELTDAGLNYARGGYTAYRVKQNSLEQSRQAIYDKQEKERQALISAIQRYREWFQKGHDAASERDPYAKKRAAKNANRFQAKTRALKQLEERSVEKPKKEMNARIDFRDGQFNAKHMITLDHVSFSFEADHLYFSLLNLSVNRGDRIAVMGQNGAGKSTLLRLLIADLTPDCGHILRHPELRVGYFAQQVDVLPMDRSILACMLELPGITQSLARESEWKWLSLHIPEA
ncbi:ABC-F family ATP-binding cassette domain-containing protein [Ferroacidibacillus organovorans]|uniref:ABC transporter domain-containing protein n=1 Tax=Ferroacidibacillus organovorans TaxID=1765683 RepID=A0A1V4EQE7_9BACL|nr:ABC-F family ATP-binding cassette domain-containing protein [Ferroacidibacillus organovorans]OPG15122.1 hypothetical protein B2M26_13300 [Ferroacidibacillus organovorans]